MSEILDRLRQRHTAWQRETGATDASTYSWAADEIDRLTEEVARLREALTGLLNAFSLGPLDAAAKHGPDFDLREHEASAVAVARAALPKETT